MFEEALKAGQYDARLAVCRELNAAGGDMRFGVGLAAVVETSGVGPFESARVTLTPEGMIVLAAGATSVGQGLPTTLAQVCADVLQVPPADIAVHLGDTRFMPHGVGSSASRSAVMAGNAVHHASTRLREKIVALAARHFEASPADVVLDDGAAMVLGLPDRRCTLREIAALAGSPLDVEWRHETPRSIGSLTVHLAVVGVDVTTGEVHPKTHFVLCDVGRGGACAGRSRRGPAPSGGRGASEGGDHFALSRTSSSGADHGYGSMSISAGSATRGPIPLGQMNS